jgi:predicted DNA-binding protein
MARNWTSRPPGSKSVRLDLSEEVHARLRVLAAQAGQPMSAYVRGLVEAVVRGENPLQAEAKQEENPPSA